MTIPRAILVEVFGDDHADALLHLLRSAEAPLRYSEARRRLDLHPEQFRRALQRLERYGLVHLRVVPPGERPERDRRKMVTLALSALGDAIVDLHDRVDAAWTKVARDHHLDAHMYEATVQVS